MTEPMQLPRGPVMTIDKDHALVRGRDGLFLVNVHDFYVGQALIHYGEYGGIEAHRLRQFCRPGDVVVEVGANIGSHSVGLARAVAPGGRLLAIEAQPAVFHLLCANVALNNLPNVRCLPVGLGARRGVMSVPVVDYSQEGNFGAVELQPRGEGERVRIERLDDVFDDKSLRLLKIDVEGMEREVIEGAARTIRRCRPILYVENDRVAKSRGLIEALLGLDYRLWWHVPPLFNPDNFFGNREDRYPRVASFNMVGLPREKDWAHPGGQEVVDAGWHPLARQ